MNPGWIAYFVNLRTFAQLKNTLKINHHSAMWLVLTLTLILQEKHVILLYCSILATLSLP